MEKKMEIIDISKEKYSTNIQQYDTDSYDTIGFTFDMKKDSDLHKKLKEIYKECDSGKTSREFSWVGSNMRFEGIGYLKSVKGRPLYSGRYGIRGSRRK